MCSKFVLAFGLLALAATAYAQGTPPAPPSTTPATPTTPATTPATPTAPTTTPATPSSTTSPTTTTAPPASTASPTCRQLRGLSGRRRGRLNLRGFRRRRG
ncbi:uncharacterized protein [Drosophila suzukii]|uniref:Uncharacterized protein n=1 Tax=Drosophila suzukii TaxID=28584 RepID=A0AB40D6P2_DROSZ